jgi:aldose 1-epimerase
LSSGGHGGRKGFDKRVWDATTSSDKQSATLSLTYLSEDGEEGYPGNMLVKLDYVLNNDNELQLRYTATTDKPTVLNLTNHSYFNLTNCRENVLNHHVIVYAETYTPYGERGSIPTGEIAPLEGTPYDVRQWTVIGDRIPNTIRTFDHYYCLDGTPNNIVLAAELYEPLSGRLLQTYTTEPGVQFYVGGSIDNRNHRNMGAEGRLMGACFEAQHYANSPNTPNFPSTVLRPGETYTQLTIYKAGIK